ncbi:hypothetical protein GCM10028804_00510 [Larkinella terrae]
MEFCQGIRRASASPKDTKGKPFRTGASIARKQKTGLFKPVFEGGYSRELLLFGRLFNGNQAGGEVGLLGSQRYVINLRVNPVGENDPVSAVG